MSRLESGSELSIVLDRGCKEHFSSEREFRERVVSRMLDLLGWSSQGEVRYEEEIQAGTVALRVDYIVGDAKRKFALEVKRPEVSVSAGSPARLQLRSYLKLDESINFGVLYNGKEMHLFTRDSELPLLSWSCGKTNPILFYISKDVYTEKALPDLQSLKLFRKFSIYLAVLSIGFGLFFSNAAIYYSTLTNLFTILSTVLGGIFLISLFAIAYYHLKYTSRKRKELMVSKRIGDMEKITGK